MLQNVDAYFLRYIFLFFHILSILLMLMLMLNLNFSPFFNIEEFLVFCL